MAILDIDKIIIKRTIAGVNCRVCGGLLKETKKKSISGRIITAATMGILKTKQYECEICKRKYLLI
jgi:uncharacterized protein with PIN domain